MCKCQVTQKVNESDKLKQCCWKGDRAIINIEFHSWLDKHLVLKVSVTGFRCLDSAHFELLSSLVLGVSMDGFRGLASAHLPLLATTCYHIPRGKVDLPRGWR